MVLATLAVGFAAADTYVVVLSLPDMMASVGLGIQQLQRGAPIVSGFLLGYVAMLPLLGRVADLRGRVPVLVAALLIFSVGSLVTASSYDLASIVTGRFIQGVGAGGLVPATLALVADMWPVERRGVPLGVVGAVQELGAVVGPLYGALVLSRWSWHAIFWINLAVGLVLAAALTAVPWSKDAVRRLDWLGLVLAGLTLTALALVMTEPERLASGVRTGRVFIPYLAGSRWSTPMALVLLALALAWSIRVSRRHRSSAGRHPRIPLLASVDLLGATLLAFALAGIVLAFATADPSVQVFAPAGPWLLGGSAVAVVLFVWRQRVARVPLVPPRLLRPRAAWGSIVVSFFVGSALIAGLVDVPIFARVTAYPDSQVDAAFVLVRLLVAIPAGAVIGGYAVHRLPPAVLTAVGMLLAALGFAWMAHWGLAALHDPVATVPLVVTGLGFGLAIAPVNAALLAATRPEVHGLASALLVVARMLGMLVGISALTTIGLRRFYAYSAAEPSLRAVCHADRLCGAYVALLKQAGIVQLRAVFWGAALCSALALGLSLALLPYAGSHGAIPDQVGVRGRG